MPDWLGALGDGVRGLARVPEADAWQQAQFDRELSRTLHASGQGAGSTRLRLADVRALLTARLAGRPTRANFRTGTLTVCTMVPMRSVPHRVVCLVGLDDGVFPRSQWIDGDDVLARRPLTGERDPRSEDRQLLLDAIMSATERLVVCYTGANEHTGAVRPPAVPLGELLDTLDRTASGDVRERVLTRHPLQAYDTANLTADGVGRGRPFSFDPAALAGARSAVGSAHPGRRSFPARCRPASRRTSASTTCTASWPTRCGTSAASGWASAPRSRHRRTRTPCRSSSTAWRPGPSATGCWPTWWPASTWSRRSWPSSCAAPCHRRASVSGP